MSLSGYGIVAAAAAGPAPGETLDTKPYTRDNAILFNGLISVARTGWFVAAQPHRNIWRQSLLIEANGSQSNGLHH